MRESYSEVEQEDEGGLSIAPDILSKSTDFLKRIIVPVKGQGGVTLSYTLIATVSRLKTTFGGSLLGTERGSAAGGVRLVAASMIGGLRTESWSYKTAGTAEMPKFCRAHAAPQGRCDNLINALKLLPNQQKDGGSPVKMVVPGLLEKKSAQNDGRTQEVCSS